MTPLIILGQSPKKNQLRDGVVDFTGLPLSAMSGFRGLVVIHLCAWGGLEIINQLQVSQHQTVGKIQTYKFYSP